MTVNIDRLNLRAEPSTDAAIIRLLYRGDVLKIVGGPESTDGYTWYQVDGDAGRGWVASKFLSLGADVNTGGSAEFAAGNRTLTTSNLNFRTEPGTGSAVIRVLRSGTLLTITDGPAAASGYTWYQGRTTAATGGDTGWVIAPGLSMAPEMPDPGREYDTGNVVLVTSDGLRLRSGGGTSNTVVGSLSRGTALTITGAPVGADGYTWYPVATQSGTSGWVASAFLTWSGGTATPSTASPMFSAGEAAIVDTSRLNFRTAPTTSASVQGQLGAGTPLTIIDGPEAANGYNWYQVETDSGTTGWVIGEALVSHN